MYLTQKKKVSAPLIKDVLVNLESILVQTLEVGGHTAFIGAFVASHTTNAGKPLIVSDKICTLEHL